MTRVCPLVALLFCSLTLRGQQDAPKKTDSTNYFSSSKDDPVIKRIIREKMFYDSILSTGNFSANLRGKLTNGRFLQKNDRYGNKDVKFRFKSDRGYVLSNSSVVKTPSNDPHDFIGGDINKITSSDHFVALLHYQYCVGNSVHGCTNYSLTLELPTLKSGDVINLSSPDALATLGYWHYGSFGGPESSVSHAGEVRVIENNGKQVKARLKCSFINSDKTGFEASGDFILPIIDRAAIEKFDQEVKAISGR